MAFVCTEFRFEESFSAQRSGKAEKEKNKKYLNHFRMQSLSRFHASVRNQHRAVEIEVDERCCLQAQLQTSPSQNAKQPSFKLATSTLSANIGCE